MKSSKPLRRAASLRSHWHSMFSGLRLRTAVSILKDVVAEKAAGGAADILGPLSTDLDPGSGKLQSSSAVL